MSHPLGTVPKDKCKWHLPVGGPSGIMARMDGKMDMRIMTNQELWDAGELYDANYDPSLQIFSSCFLSAMATASERLAAPSFAKTRCRCFLTPTSVMPNCRAMSGEPALGTETYA